MKGGKFFQLVVYQLTIFNNMVLLSTVCIFLVSFSLHYLIKTVMWVIRAENMTANIPGPKPWPIIGNALLLTRLRSSKGNKYYQYFFLS